MLDYKDILNKHYVLHLSAREISRQAGVSKSGILKFIRAFELCNALDFPLPPGITNAGIAQKVYGKSAKVRSRDESYEYPDYQQVHRLMNERKNMTLQVCWARYCRRCKDEGKKSYQYRQFCELFSKWCDENYETAHFTAVIAQTMEVDFAGKTFSLINRLTGDVTPIVVFVAVLPYSQYIYAEGMSSTKEMYWIEVNNHALQAFGGVPALVVCDNCKQAVIANKDWIEPELNQDYAEWAEHNHTVILPAKVRKPKFKSSVENAVGILEKGLFHDLAERRYFTLEQFNADLWEKIGELNDAPFKKKEHCRSYYWEDEKAALMPLPDTAYHYMERRIAKVSSDFHIRFDNVFYSVDKAYLHKKVLIRASASEVKIFSVEGELIVKWPRAYHKGTWCTNPEHLPDKYKDYSEWNSTYFIRRASTIGVNTTELIKRILKSRKLEVQTYRLCIGVLGFVKKYSRATLEECCKQALETQRPTYSYIKNAIAAVAEGLGTAGYNTAKNKKRNEGAYVMDSSYSDMEKLLKRSRALADKSEKGEL